jgi:hypothetical protein
VIRRLRTDERGITPVLGAALVLGTIITVLSVFLAVWVPGELNRRNREHMESMEESFRELRGEIEGLEVGESRSVHVDMSPEPLPLVPDPKTSGTLSTLPLAGENYGIIKFELGDQSLIYESGMLILDQNNENLMKSASRVVTVKKVGDKLEVHFEIIKVRGLKSWVGGIGISAITVSILQENLMENGMLQENVNIQINSSYYRAWNEYLQELCDEFEEKGYHPEVANLQLTILGEDNTPGTKDIHYYEKVTEIWVSIS